MFGFVGRSGGKGSAPGCLEDMLECRRYVGGYGQKPSYNFRKTHPCNDPKDTLLHFYVFSESNILQGL
jgi:hypothetical protein